MEPDRNTPNIVIICADQLRPFELGCHGHPVVQTPQIDRLASAGVRFEYACTTNPLCTPARSSLISGQYGRTCIGMLGCCGDPAAGRTKFPDATLPELLGQAGYETMLCGKWHIEANPLSLGFERAFYPAVHHLNRDQTYFDGAGHRQLVPGFGPDTELNVACDFINQPHDRPFFLFHNICLPHMPFFDVPETWRSRYPARAAQLRPNVFRDGQPWHDLEALKVYWWDWLYTKQHAPDLPPLPDSFDLRQLTALYYGMIAAVDAQVGKLLEGLTASGQLDNTIVILSADHGENLGSHWLWNKISVNDEAIRVPLLVRWPQNLKPRVVSQHVASLVDIAPTVLALCGLPVPAHLQGRDLSPVLTGHRERIGDGEALIENLFGEVAVRTPDHLYAILTRTRADGPGRDVIDDQFLFHDTQRDPFQQHNLAGAAAEQAETAARLRQRALAWNARTPWLAGSRGGVYAQGPQHDPAPRPPRSFG